MSVSSLVRLCSRLSRPSQLSVCWRRYGSIAEATSVQLESASGGLTVGGSSYHPAWLRHNCQCPECWCNHSDQKTHDVFEISANNLIKSAEIKNGRLELMWSSGHHGYVELDWLDQRQQRPKEDTTTPTVATEYPILSAEGIFEDKEKLWQWLHLLNEYGVCILSDFGVEKERVGKLAETMYHKLATVYGETFEVEAFEKPFNVSASTRRLEFHMDLLFYEVPPGLQLLHSVEFDNCVVGGESVLLDMFAVAEEMRVKHPQHFNTLARVPATFQRKHKDRAEPVNMEFSAPHIQLDSNGKVIGLRWNPSIEGTLKAPPEDLGPYYEAWECLYSMIQSSPLQLTHRLRPGEVLTFNNRRMLHSRNEFTLNGGRRLLQGVYVNIDHFKSTYNVLSNLLEKKAPMRRVFNNQSF